MGLPNDVVFSGRRAVHPRAAARLGELHGRASPPAPFSWDARVGFLSKLSGMLGRGPVRQTIGEWRVLGVIADGPMSVVYKAVSHRQDNRVAAVKVLKDSAVRVAARLSTELGKQWEGERALGLVHPNVVRTLACDCRGGTYYMVMEFIDGHSLASLIYEYPATLPGRRLSIIRQVAQGLAFLHGKGLIHRDICPKNVLVDGPGNAKLIDFGVAVSLEDRLRNTGRRTGRPSYMAPELIRDNVFDFRTDIYALGVTMYEVCTGAKPLAGADRYEKMRQHLHIVPTPPADVNPSVPLALSNAISRCLAKDPDNRFQTVDELLAALPDAPF